MDSSLDLVQSMQFSFYFQLASYILITISWYKIFEKAGSIGWYAFVPILNILELLRVVKMHYAFLILFFIPNLNFIVYAYLCYKVSLAFNKSKNLYSIGLFFLPFIFFPQLAFGDSKYKYAKNNDINNVPRPSHSDESVPKPKYEDEVPKPPKQNPYKSEVDSMS